MRGNQQFRLLQDFPTKNEFLQIAARQTARRGLCIRRLDCKAPNDFVGQCAHLAALDQAIAHQPLLEGGKQRVVGETEFRHCAMPQALGRDECQAALAPRIGAQVADRGILKTQGRRLGVRQGLFAAEQRQQFILTITGHACDTDDFAAAYFQAEVFE